MPSETEVVEQPETSAPAATQFDESAEMDSALDAIFGNTSPKVREPEVQAAPEEESAAPVEASTPATPTSSEDRTRARNVAQLEGLPAHVIDKMSEAEVQAWLGNRTKRESGLNARLARLAELERERPDSQATAGAERKAPTVPTADLGEIPAAITEELGADTAKALKSWLEAQIGPLKAALGQAQQERATSAIQREVEAMRAAGEIHLPAGDLDPTLIQTAEALAQVPGPWSSLEGKEAGRALLKRAAIALYGEAPRAESETEKKEAAHAQKNGKPSSVKSRTATRVPVSPTEAEDIILDAIFRGEDVEAVKKKHGIG